MKRIIIYVVFCIGLSSWVDAQTIRCINNYDDNEVEIEFNLPQFQILDSTLPEVYGNTTKYNWISVDDEEFGIIDSVGMPCLPKLTFSINLPENAYNIICSLDDSSTFTLDLQREIIPYQEDFSADDSTFLFLFSQNNSYYSSIIPFYNQRFSISTPFQIREKKGVGITIFPFKYTPGSDKLDIMSFAKLRVKYSIEGEVSDYPVSPVFDEYYSAVFKNYKSVGCSNEIRYLIVTASEFENNLAPFVEYKRNLGYTVSVEAISPTEMSSEAVKSLIQSYYNNVDLRPDFILLVGESGKLPPFSSSPTVTDLDYVLLEGGDDLEVDAFIGRWPVYDCSDLKKIITKTIYAEMNMQQMDKNALFVSGDDCSWWPKTFFMRRSFEVGHEHVIGCTFNPDGYSCELRYQPYLQTVRNWMSWNPLIFVYSGHGGELSMGRMYCDDNEESKIKSSFFNNIQNTFYPMVFSFACNTGDFAYGNNVVSICESWIRNKKGSVTFFGSSRKTLNSSDRVIEEKVLGDAFVGGRNRCIGKTVALGMRRYRDYYFTCDSHAVKYTRAYNLLGDPSFLVKGLSCPLQYVINGDNIITKEIKEYYASERIVIGDGANVENGEELFLSAGGEIVFEDGFEAASGSEMDAWIEGCTSGTVSMINVSNYSGNDYEGSIDDVSGVETSSFKLYPNPAVSEITLEFDAVSTGDALFQMYDMKGKMVCEKSVPIVCVGHQTIAIPLRTLVPAGSYYVVLKTVDNSYSSNLIKK